MGRFNCKVQSTLPDSARAEYHQAIVCREEKSWGHEIARLDKAQSYLKGNALCFLKLPT
jgi:hypothetical protein